MWPPKTDCRFGIYIEKYGDYKKKINEEKIQVITEPLPIL